MTAWPPFRARLPWQPFGHLYLLAPLPFLIVLPVLYYFYKLDKIYPQVMAELEEREKKGSL